MNIFKNISLMPILIAIVLLSFSVRLMDVVQAVVQNKQTVSSTTAFAADEKENKAEEDLVENSEVKEDVLKDAQKKSAKKGTTSKWRDATEEDFSFRAVEIEHEKDMEDQRKKLDDRERDLDAREALLKAAEQELAQKHKELVQIRNQIEELLGDQQQQEQEQIQSLVKIYEGMKAKEAAAIFNSLDIDVLLEVLTHMSERKAAPIIAKMNPERAKTITVMLAEQKKLPSIN